MFQVRFGSIVAHEGDSEREALRWYQALVLCAHEYGRRLELRQDTELIAFISAHPAVAV